MTVYSPPPKKKLTLSASSISAPKEGGVFTIRYELDAASEKPKLKADCPETWVHSFDFTEENIISFEVDWNETTKTREAVVEITLSDGSSNQSFTVRQAAGEKRPRFVITVDELSDSSVSAMIVPLNEQMSYINICMSKAEYDKLGSDEALFDLFARTYGEQAQAAGMTLVSYLESIERLFRGERLYRVEGLDAETEYYLCAVEISSTGEQASEMVKTLIETPAVQMIDMSFDIKYDVTGPNVTMTVTPSDEKQYYVFDIVAKESIEITELIPIYQTVLQKKIEEYKEMFGISTVNVVRQFIASKGVAATTLELQAETTYYGFAVSINSVGIINSQPKICEFVTGSVGASDNNIAITLTAVGDRKVNYSITTTTDDPYIFNIVEASKVEGMTEQQILTEQTSGAYNLEQLKMQGNKTGTISRLLPETDYVALAFGYFGDKVTTKLFRQNFTTQANVVGAVTFDLNYDYYFDGNEISQIYPDLFPAYLAADKAVLPVQVNLHDNEADEYFYHIFAGAPATPDGMEAYIYKTLMNQGYTTSTGVFYASYGTEYTLAGFAVDMQGHYGPIFWKKINLTPEGASPVENYRPASVRTRMISGAISAIPAWSSIGKTEVVSSTFSAVPNSVSLPVFCRFSAVSNTNYQKH